LVVRWHHPRRLAAFLEGRDEQAVPPRGGKYLRVWPGLVIEEDPGLGTGDGAPGGLR
jgi:hypothetical protein